MTVSDVPRLPRSPELMSRHDTALLVVDVQERLIGQIASHERLVWNVGRLLQAAKALGVRIVGTEQYPQGLGPTVPELAEHLGTLPQQIDIQLRRVRSVFHALAADDIHKILVVGIEAHVCVQQTVMDLLADGFRVYLAVDAVGSRYEIDYQTALRRMDSAGATLTTTEATLFEWCDVAGTPEFKAISALARQTAPASD